MHIAFISYEAPPENLHGGIATYMGQAPPMLASAGHDVEVFTASRETSDSLPLNGVRTHRVQSASYIEFAERVVHVFADRHAASPFDVLEAPEFQAEYRHVIRRFPDVPLVVKLHTPTFMIRRLMNEGWRYDQPAWRRKVWRLQNRYGVGLDHAPDDDPEREFVRHADIVSAPSRAISKLVVDEWHVDRRKVDVL